MIEIKGNIWNLASEDDWICVTTNGNIKNNGKAVMGRGIAYQAAVRFPMLPDELAERLREFGNKLFIFPNFNIVTFPTKNNWWEDSSLELIKESTLALKKAHERFSFANNKIFLPRPGCSNGKLNYNQVKPILEEILRSDLLDEDPFVIVSL